MLNEDEVRGGNGGSDSGGVGRGNGSGGCGGLNCE